MRRRKSLRIGVHHADALVWEPVYRTHLSRAGSCSGTCAGGTPRRRRIRRGGCDTCRGGGTRLVSNDLTWHVVWSRMDGERRAVSVSVSRAAPEFARPRDAVFIRLREVRRVLPQLERRGIRTVAVAITIGIRTAAAFASSLRILMLRHRRALALLPRASGRVGNFPVEVIDRFSRAVPRHHAPVRAHADQEAREDEQRRDLRGVRAQRDHLVRAAAHVYVSPHRREREVVPNRERDDLAVELRAHEREAKLVAVVDLPRSPRGDGDEGLGAAALRRERDVLGDVPERAERVEERGGGRRRRRRRRHRGGRIVWILFLLSRRRADSRRLYRVTATRTRRADAVRARFAGSSDRVLLLATTTTTTTTTTTRARANDEAPRGRTASASSDMAAAAAFPRRTGRADSSASSRSSL